MEVLAITSGNPVAGATILAAFVLGTSPLFALVGVATAKLSETFKQSFMKLAAALLVFLALSSFNGILTVLNSPLTFEKLTQSVTYFFSQERFAGKKETLVETVGGAQQVLIQINPHGYAPNKIKVRAGIPVALTLKTEDTYSCASSFVLRAFNIEMQLAPTDSQTVTFIPTQKGKFPFTCSMGMYSGVLEVI
jgi:heme/copper-type cytochrome/quinol oxidase subunit 2